MPTVQRLDEHSISRIAAGEVILHPAMAVKELVENALDAGATRLEIAIAGGGLELIRVTDDGCGMQEGDGRLALERHATSKIRNADDIETVESFGFRGEAMPAMASIARMEILTRPLTEETGVRILVDGGELKSVAAAAAPPGTTVVLKNLFYNAPVRRRFQKAARTETTRVVDLLGRYVLIRPDVAFRLEVDGELRLVTRAGADCRENIAVLYGAEFARGLLPVEHRALIPELGELELGGWCSGPELVRGSGKWQMLFVNGRPVENRTVSQALREAYAPILPPRRFPAAFLFLRIDPRRVDVNVHPTKKDVLFTDERPVFGFILRGITAAFAGLDLRANLCAAPAVLPRWDAKQTTDDPGVQGHFGGRGMLPDLALDSSGPGETETGGSPSVRPWISAVPAHDPPVEVPLQAGPGLPAGFSSLPTLACGERAADAAVPERYRILGQFYDTFIALETSEGILLVDQHVASERVNYERLQAKVAHGDVGGQGLLVPVLIDVGVADKLRIEGNLARLVAEGFRVEPFGPGTFAVEEVPAWLGDRLERGAMRELLCELVEHLPRRREDLRHHLLATVACKQSIKAGEVLSPAQSCHLIAALFACANPWRCPHGRPIVLALPLTDLLRRFGRL